MVKNTVAKSGCPQLIIPHITDQFYYGQSVFLNELGPKPIPFNRIDVLKLTRGLLELNSPKFRKSTKIFALVCMPKRGILLMSSRAS